MTSTAQSRRDERASMPPAEAEFHRECNAYLRFIANIPRPMLDFTIRLKLNLTVKMFQFISGKPDMTDGAWMSATRILQETRWEIIRLLGEKEKSKCSRHS